MGKLSIWHDWYCWPLDQQNKWACLTFEQLCVHLSKISQFAELHNASEPFPASPWKWWDQVKTRWERWKVKTRAIRWERWWGHLRLFCSSWSLPNLTCSSSSCFLAFSLWATARQLYDEKQTQYILELVSSYFTCFSSSTKLALLLCTDHLSIASSFLLKFFFNTWVFKV